MLDPTAWIVCARLNHELLALADHWMSLSWTLLATKPVVISRPLLPRDVDLRALSLERMPSSADELRTAYRRAAKVAHPDTGGSAEAFRVVTEAFGRLAREHALAV